MLTTVYINVKRLQLVFAVTKVVFIHWPSCTTVVLFGLFLVICGTWDIFAYLGHS